MSAFDVRKEHLWRLVQQFMLEQDISGPECIYQSDRVILNAHDLLDKLCETVGYPEMDKDALASPDSSQ